MLAPIPFSLFEHLDRQLHQAEGTPVAEIRENDDRYQLAVELSGIRKDAIEVKATEHGRQSARSGPTSMVERTMCSANFAMVVGAATSTLARNL